MLDDLAREVVEQGRHARIRTILSEVCQLTDMGFAAVARVTDRRWIACQVVDRIEFGLDPGDELAIATTICSDIRDSGEAVVIDYVDAHPNWRTHAIPALYGFQSYASFPIHLADGSFYGTLCAIDPAPHEVSGEAVLAAMERYAREIAALIEGGAGLDESAGRPLA